MYIYWHGRVCLEPRLRVWAQAAGAKGALCTCCRSRCCISRLGSCDGQWELMALVLRKTVSLPSSFLFLTEPMAIKNARPLPGYWLYHGKCQMYSYSSEWKSLLPGLSKIEGSVSPAIGHFFPCLVHPPLFKKIKSH